MKQGSMKNKNNQDNHGNQAHDRFAEILTRNLVDDSNKLINEDINQIRNVLSRLSQTVTTGSSCLDINQQEKKLFQNNANKLPWFSQDQQNSVVLMQGNYLYLNKYNHSERSIEESLQTLASITHNLNEAKIKQKLHDLRYMDELSKEVILTCLRQNLSVITGGPGTGKTTIVVRVLALLMDQFKQTHSQFPNIEVLAPTGKASARVKESIVKEKSYWLENLEKFDKATIQAIPDTAQTVHKFLAINPITGKTKYQRGKKANVDIVVVDEASMLDILLMNKLLKALKPSTQLILLGDPYQLASVEAGNVLAQIVTSSQLPQNEWLKSCCIQLTKSHRFDENSGIGKLAEATNKGESSKVINLLEDETFPDVELIDSKEAKSTAINGYKQYKSVIEQLSKLESLTDKDREMAFKAFDTWQVFSPYRSNLIGVAWLNEEIEKALKLGTPESYYFGKPIIIKENDHSLKLNNGDIGICLDKKGQRICFPKMTEEGELTYRDVKTRVLPEHDLVYAMTVHKSQGSEYESCFLYVPEPNENQKALLTREIFYTALTRAKKSFVLSAGKNEIKTMVETPTKRTSGLLENQ